MLPIKKLTLSLLIGSILVGCATTSTVEQLPPPIVKDKNAFDILIAQFANDVEMIWGRDEVLIAGSKDYVKYTDHYQTRSHINFAAGVITVETILDGDPSAYLRQTIITTLLMGDNPGNIDLYSDEAIQISKTPFLYGQVVDHENQPIRWEWRAIQFADYLIANHLQQRHAQGKTIWSVTIKLVPNHIDKRASKYMAYIRKAAEKYHVDEGLILAIMETESSFNPYAVSRSDALGLMQIMPQTAGRDVFKLHGRSGVPSRRYLFDPEKNIDMGAAYLSLLQDHYLVNISHPTAKRYAVISAYNGGAGSVLRIFSSDKALAARKINQLSPEKLYEILTTRHPSNESRQYLHKVNTAHTKYRHP